MKRQYTDEERKAFGEKMKALREAKKLAVLETAEEPNDTITLNFTKPIEVGINGKMYVGKQIEVKDMKIAAEIVRIAKTAYGWDILG